jgi:hypothetical protein
MKWYLWSKKPEMGDITKKNSNGEVTIVQLMKSGPLLVFGNIIVRDSQGNETEKNNVTSFCRCGSSQKNPYCDGTHIKKGFKE